MGVRGRGRGSVRVRLGVPEQRLLELLSYGDAGDIGQIQGDIRRPA